MSRSDEATVIQGDALSVLSDLDSGLARCCVTSPPYWGLRDYGVAGQIGLEAAFSEYVDRLVAVFREVSRVLADDGTLWLVIGDSYSHGGNGSRDPEKWPRQSRNDHRIQHAKMASGLKRKDLVGIPWRVAFALQEDGWYLRSDIIWHKPSPMPESVTDRPTKAHEYIFLLSKQAHYYYNVEAIREPTTRGLAGSSFTTGKTGINGRGRVSDKAREDGTERNKRSVWTVASQPYADAHFAVFPPKLIEPCILAGSAVGDTVLDPFSGTGTTGIVALRHGRNYLGIELNPEYVDMSRRRITGDAPLFNQVVTQ